MCQGVRVGRVSGRGIAIFFPFLHGPKQFKMTIDSAGSLKGDPPAFPGTVQLLCKKNSDSVTINNDD